MEEVKFILDQAQKERMGIEETRRNREIDKALEAAQKIDVSDNDAGMCNVLKNTLLRLREARPDERSERARRYAITITEMEKVYAYFRVFVVDAKEME